MATKFSKSKASADNANRGLYKKGGSTMKKYQYAGETGPAETFSSRKTKTVSVSPDKNYKTTVKQKMSPSGSFTKVSNRRTIKGIVTGAPKGVNSAPMKKTGGSMKYQTGGTAVEPKRKVGDTAYGRSVPVTKITGNKGNPQGAPKSDTVPVRYGPPVRVKRATGTVVKAKWSKGGSTKKK